MLHIGGNEPADDPRGLDAVTNGMANDEFPSSFNSTPWSAEDSGQTGLDYIGWYDAISHRSRRLLCSPFPFLLADPAFSGRGVEVAFVRRAVQSGMPCLISGAPGIGKTAVALQALSLPQISAFFLDGILWFEAGKMSFAALCDEIARQLGDKTIPALLDVDEKAAALGAFLAHKSVLVVLDGLEDGALALRLCQEITRQLLVTCREPFSLEGASHLPLGALSEVEAVACFRAYAGHLSAHEDQVAAVCALLGYHPLAIALAAAYLRVQNVRPPLLYAGLTEILAQLPPVMKEQDALLPVRLTFDLLYNLLDDEQRILLAACGIFDRDFSAGAAAAISGKWRQRTDLWLKRVLRCSAVSPSSEQNWDDVEREWTEWVCADLGALTQLGLLRKAGRHHDRYRLAPLLAELIAAKPNADAEAMRQRAIAYYRAYLKTRRADHAAIALEKENLLEALSWAYERGCWEEVIDYACCLEAFWQEHGYLREAAAYFGWALEGNSRLGHLNAELYLYQCLGTNAFLQMDYEGARGYYRRGLALAVACGDQPGMGRALHALGNISYCQGEYEQALDYYQRSLTKREMVADEAGRAAVLCALGRVYQRCGTQQQAQEHFLRSLKISETQNDETALGYLCHQLGELAQASGEQEQAAEFYERSLAYKEQLGDQAGSARTLYRLAMLHMAQSQLDLAYDQLQRTLRLATEPGDLLIKARALYGLGNILYQRGVFAQAEEQYRQSLALEEQLADQIGVAACLHAIGMILHDQGNYTQAREYYVQSIEIAEALGRQSEMAATYLQLGTIDVIQGDYASAARYYERSLELARAAGDRAGISATLHQLGVICQNQGAYDQARQHYDRSLTLSQEMGDKWGAAATLHQLGLIHSEQGEYLRARRYFAYSLKIREALGRQAGPGAQPARAGQHLSVGGAL